MMLLSELLKLSVVTESGRRLGRVHDVRGEVESGKLRVTGLVAGKLSLLERYGLRVEKSAEVGRPKAHGHPVIEWERVVRVGREIVVRDE